VVLTSRAIKHYLAGTVYCDLCDSKLIFMLSRGRAGEIYGYWACLGRHTYKNGCELPYLPDEVVEEEVIKQWRLERLTEAEAAQIRDGLLADLTDYTRTTTEQAALLDRRISAIQRQRRQWAEKAMDGTVPDDIARDKQRDLAAQLATAKTQRTRLRTTTATYDAGIRQATEFVARCDLAYHRSPKPLRRDFNQAWFDRLAFRAKNGQPVIAEVRRTEWAEALHTAQVQDAVIPEPTETPDNENVFQRVLDNGNARTGPK
jgi:hypothetical protein